MPKHKNYILTEQHAMFTSALQAISPEEKENMTTIQRISPQVESEKHNKNIWELSNYKRIQQVDSKSKYRPVSQQISSEMILYKC